MVQPDTMLVSSARQNSLPDRSLRSERRTLTQSVFRTEKTEARSENGVSSIVMRPASTGAGVRRLAGL
jgi:hypothetical protein